LIIISCSWLANPVATSKEAGGALAYSINSEVFFGGGPANELLLLVEVLVPVVDVVTGEVEDPVAEVEVVVPVGAPGLVAT
jgi:hypothetical protein